MEDDTSLKSCMDTVIRGSVIPPTAPLPHHFHGPRAVPLPESIHRGHVRGLRHATNPDTATEAAARPVRRRAVDALHSPPAPVTPSRNAKRILQLWRNVTNVLSLVVSSETDGKKKKEKAIGILTDLQTFPRTLR